MDKLENKYQADRSWLLIITVFTLINMFFIVTEVDRSFYFSAFIPMVASAYAHYFYSGMLRLLTVVIFCALVVLIFLVSYLSSKKNYFWFLVAAIIYSVDLAAMLMFALSRTFETCWILDLILHFIALIFLYHGFFIGRKLYGRVDKYNSVQNLNRSTEVDYLTRE